MEVFDFLLSFPFLLYLFHQFFSFEIIKFLSKIKDQVKKFIPSLSKRERILEEIALPMILFSGLSV
jgi:hypothetical protein